METILTFHALPLSEFFLCFLSAARSLSPFYLNSNSTSRPFPPLCSSCSFTPSQAQPILAGLGKEAEELQQLQKDYELQKRTLGKNKPKARPTAFQEMIADLGKTWTDMMKKLTEDVEDAQKEAEVRREEGAVGIV